MRGWAKECVTQPHFKYLLPMQIALSRDQYSRLQGDWAGKCDAKLHLYPFLNVPIAVSWYCRGAGAAQPGGLGQRVGR